jgi:lysyl-tRNA synthetase class 2
VGAGYPRHVDTALTRTTAAAPDTDLPEQMQVRLDKRARMLAEGRDPYPVGVPRTHTLAEVRSQWGSLSTGEETQDVVGVAGRVVFIRNTGKLCFATLQEGDGTRLQAMLSVAEVGAEALAAWKADVDLGDHVFVHGRVVSSRRGELSVMADEWRMVSKALRPLPTLHKELSEEARVRPSCARCGRRWTPPGSSRWRRRSCSSSTVARPPGRSTRT